ncbi:MAG TPA: hypothetical protein VF433_03865 [Cellvibrio sp.]
MEISQITYRRVFSLGNYETETIEVTALVHFSESAEKVYAELRDWTIEQFLSSHPDVNHHSRKADSPQSLRQPT